MSATTSMPGSPPPITVPQRIARIVGWVLIALGIHILLYLSYLLWWTNLETHAAQEELLEEFTLDFGDPTAALPGEFLDGPPQEAEVVEPGQAYAAMWFERDGERIVNDDVLYVVQGVQLSDLRKGPGHDPRSAPPGGEGNFVISGHRTTYGAPFYNLDQLQAGDEVHVVDRDARQWVYVVAESRIVRPTDVWVIRDGAYGDGPILTLTTCNPRFSASQRLIVFAELRQDGTDAEAEADGDAAEAA